MKREVASSLVERGVTERVRLTQAYEKKKTELQKQHDIVKNQLNDHKEKVCQSNFNFHKYAGNSLFFLIDLKVAKTTTTKKKCARKFNF